MKSLPPDNRLLIGFPEYRKPAQRLARAANLPWVEAEIHHFPDGESRVRLPENLPEQVIFCRSLHQPNDKLVELMLAAATARKSGAQQLTLVAPYLCYMRQDKAFHPGEAVSQRIIGAWLARWFDTLITVDPHLHRVHDLGEAMPVKQAVALTATGVMSEYLAQQQDNPWLIGPDEESAQWVAAIARKNRLDYCVATKQRLGDRDVRITLPDGNYANRHIVLVDDMASTGRTLEATAKALQACRPACISVLVTHALFGEEVMQRLRDAGIGHICSSDTIVHSTNKVQLASLLGRALEG